MEVYDNTYPEDADEYFDEKITHLTEDIDDESDIAEEELVEYAITIGIDPDKEEQLMWIAKKGLTEPLPKQWRPYQDERGDIFYHNTKSKETRWEHPLDEQYRKLVKSERGKGLSRYTPSPSQTPRRKSPSPRRQQSPIPRRSKEFIMKAQSQKSPRRPRPSPRELSEHRHNDFAPPAPSESPQFSFELNMQDIGALGYEESDPSGDDRKQVTESDSDNNKEVDFGTFDPNLSEKLQNVQNSIDSQTLSGGTGRNSYEAAIILETNKPMANNLSPHTEVISKKDHEMMELRQMLKKEQGDLESQLRQEAENIMMALRDNYKHLQNDEEEKLIHKRDSFIASLRESHQLEMDKERDVVNSDHALQLEGLKAEHELQMHSLKREMNEKRQIVVRDLRDEFDKETIEAKSKLQQDMAVDLAAYRQELDDIATKEKIKLDLDHYDLIDKHKSDMQEKEKKVLLKAHNEVIEKLKQELAVQFEAKRKSIESQEQQNLSTYQRNMSEVYRRSQEESNRKHEKKLKEFKEDLDNRYKSEATSMKSTFDEHIEENKLQALKTKTEQEAHLKSRESSLLEEYRKRWEKLTRMKESELEDLAADHQAKLDKLISDNKDDLAMLREDLTKDYAVTKESLIKDHELELSKLKEDHKFQMRDTEIELKAKEGVLKTLMEEVMMKKESTVTQLLEAKQMDGDSETKASVKEPERVDVSVPRMAALDVLNAEADRLRRILQDLHDELAVERKIVSNLHRDKLEAMMTNKELANSNEVLQRQFDNLNEKVKEASDELKFIRSRIDVKLLEDPSGRSFAEDVEPSTFGNRRRISFSDDGTAEASMRYHGNTNVKYGLLSSDPTLDVPARRIMALPESEAKSCIVKEKQSLYNIREFLQREKLAMFKQDEKLQSAKREIRFDKLFGPRTPAVAEFLNDLDIGLDRKGLELDTKRELVKKASRLTLEKEQVLTEVEGRMIESKIESRHEEPGVLEPNTCHLPVNSHPMDSLDENTDLPSDEVPTHDDFSYTLPSFQPRLTELVSAIGLLGQGAIVQGAPRQNLPPRPPDLAMMDKWFDYMAGPPAHPMYVPVKDQMGAMADPTGSTRPLTLRHEGDLEKQLSETRKWLRERERENRPSVMTAANSRVSYNV